VQPAQALAVRHLQVDEESAGQRLDNFLLRCLRGVPKAHLYRVIRSGEVRVNKARAQPDQRLQANDDVRVPPMRVSPERVVPASSAQAPVLPVLLEDEHLLAIDKPSGMAVHGGSGIALGVIEQLRAQRPLARGLQLVHRLDRDTSGILLVAKKGSALRALQEQFRQRETGKVYLALVGGAWPERLKVIDQPLQRYLLDDGERRVRVASADAEGAQRAITLVRALQRFTSPDGAPATLLQVTLKTGRTHQIRVHLAQAGHPIVGDSKYGDAAIDRAWARHGLRRLFLHAWRLQFEHPADARTMELTAPLAPELVACVPGWSEPDLSHNSFP
jgi:23S rRNA pseudouridine955/2504/2580 synthase